MHPYQLPYMEQWAISVAHPAMCNWPLRIEVKGNVCNSWNFSPTKCNSKKNSKNTDLGICEQKEILK